MATKKKLLEAAAGSAGGAGGLNVEDVFSTYLFNGSGSTSQDIVNGIDLSGEGGLVWHKSRSHTYDHALMDTENGVNKFLRSNTTAAIETLTGQGLTSFNSNGYTIVRNSSTANPINGFDSSYTYASWTFRKAPKFFDVVTYTGDGTSQRGVNHNLGVEPSVIIIKRTDVGGDNWWVAARSSGDLFYYALILNATNAALGPYNYKANGYPISDTQFFTYVGSGTSGECNASGGTYVAYLFAHNNGDGDFGPTGDQDIIKCGSYTGNGSTDGPEVNLGFEPQWLLVKNTDATYNWHMWDNMRGVTTGGDDAFLYANTTAAEANYNGYSFNATGFKVENTSPMLNSYGANYIYIAIRRGPMGIPESATDVFDVVSQTPDSNLTGTYVASSTGVVDFISTKVRNASGITDWGQWDRLRGGARLKTNSTSAEYDFGTTYNFLFDYNDGVLDNFYYPQGSVTSPVVYHMWKRAPNFFDVVAYTGNGVAGRTVSHNLGVAPEMIWVKARNKIDDWPVFHKDVPNTQYLKLNGTNAVITASTVWNNTSPTETDFTVGTYTGINGSSYNYIAYLFASLDGVSKVGSYTGDGTSDGSKVIDCGFSAGARFVLIKKTSEAGNWITYDTERGIVSGNDSHLFLEQASAEDTSFDSITPNSSGFAVNHIASNKSGVSYIFYAIA